MRVERAIIKATRGSSCLITSCKINHLGRKPERGGSPASDNRAVGSIMAKAGAFFAAMERLLSVVTLLTIREEKVAVVTIMYTDSASAVREGLN